MPLFPGPVRILTIFLMAIIIMAPEVLTVQAQEVGPDTEGATHILIESRFKLWDPQEKMLDKVFYVYAFHFDPATNNTGQLIVLVNFQEWYNGTFKNWTRQSITYDNETLARLEVRVNGETYLLAEDIIIVSGITQRGIREYVPNFLEILPTEWTRTQWNQFLGTLAGGLFAIYCGYRAVSVARKKRGGRQIA